jgi:hypothetical protein
LQSELIEVFKLFDCAIAEFEKSEVPQRPKHKTPEFSRQVFLTAVTSSDDFNRRDIADPYCIPFFDSW